MTHFVEIYQGAVWVTTLYGRHRPAYNANIKHTTDSYFEAIAVAELISLETALPLAPHLREAP